MDERPRRRWHHASTHLDRFAIVTWATEPGRVERHLPPGWRADSRVVPGHGDAAFVSVVPFLDRGFHFRGAPWPRLSCGQVNHRTYVVAPDGRRGVWFFATSLDSRFAVVPRRLWRMPWRREQVRVDEAGDELRYAVDGPFAPLRIVLRPTNDPLGPPPPFADAAEASAVVVDPAVGWYRREDRAASTGRYSVWHEPLALRGAAVVEADVSLHRRLDLVDAARPPLWAGTLATTTFDVHTPPVVERPGDRPG